MRTIKNFFHNINDVLLAVIIVAVAAGIIYWRMGVILDYPKQLAAEQASYQQEDQAAVDEEAEEETEEEAEEAADDEAAAEDEAGADADEADDAEAANAQG